MEAAVEDVAVEEMIVHATSAVRLATCLASALKAEDRTIALVTSAERLVTCHASARMAVEVMIAHATR